MTYLITSAIPTDAKAKLYLEEHPELHDHKAISPLTARKLYDRYISDKRNFICPTDSCNAPITCRSISSSSLNSPTFVNQSLSINKHIKTCRYHPKNESENVLSSDDKQNRFTQLKTGKVISDLSLTNGFKPRNSSNSKSFSTTENPDYKNASGNKRKAGNTKVTRAVNAHLKTLQDHVEAYKFDKNFEIQKQSSNQKFPIKFMFKHISKNIFYEELNDQNYSYIYYGNAFLNNTKNDEVMRLSFTSHLNYKDDNTHKYHPAFIISKEYLKNEYTDIYDAFITNKQTKFEVYTTLPFLWVKDSSENLYLNFSSTQSKKSIEPFSDELLYNVFIS